VPFAPRQSPLLSLWTFCPHSEGTLFGWSLRAKLCARQYLLDAQSAQVPDDESFVAFFKRSDKIPKNLAPTHSEKPRFC